MDYDRYDFLHHIFKQTQGDAWFRPNESSFSPGVALRITDHPPQFRVFPYENASLEPFETAVAALNPVVAVKVRSAAVHAALADVPPDEKSIYVDSNTRIQIIDSILLLPHAEKEQSAAFIRDERVLIVWSDSLDTIIPTCADFENSLIKLLWRSRPVTTSPSTAPSVSASLSGHSLRSQYIAARLTPKSTTDTEKQHSDVPRKRSWFFKGRGGDESADERSELDLDVSLGIERGQSDQRWDSKRDARPAKLYAPVYNGIAAGLAFLFIGSGVKVLVQESLLDGSFTRFALCALLPFLYCVSLFFALQIVQNISMAIGPIAHYHENSKYYSALPPRANKAVDDQLPHVTIEMPVFKESLAAVLTPSILSLKKAMQTYARQGGTSSIFIHDDGLRLLPAPARDARLAFYATHGIGWVARPPHDVRPGGFVRAGRFKKASNLNYGLALSLRLERCLERLRDGTAAAGVSREGAQYEGAEAQPGAPTPDEWEDLDLEERALLMAMEEVYVESGRRDRPWGANGRAIRMGELVLLVDCDTTVPEDCLRDAAREMAECPRVAVLQHASDVMQVANHYFENGIAYFTRRINRCISMACANGEVAPFVGHNAFLRWQALQDAAFVDRADGVEKIWSEANVSEDFDMALRLQMRGYSVRWATYSRGAFKEGVSLTADDELNRWQKYAYGCSELLFNPLVQWVRKGPVAHQIHRFMWSSAPMHYKISMLAYMFSYYGIAASVTIGVVNYVLLGFAFPVDGFYMHSFEVWLATTVVFFGSGNAGYTLLEYRLGEKRLFESLWQNVMWIPFFFFFFGGLAIPISQAILAYLFSYDMSWSATLKEVERSNFFREVPKIVKRFWFSLAVSTVLIAGMVVCSTGLVPLEWRVDGSGWAVVFPLAVSTGCHVLFPIVLNPWLMIFSY